MIKLTRNLVLQFQHFDQEIIFNSIKKMLKKIENIKCL